MKKTRFNVTAATFRLVLFVSLFAIIGLSIGGFVYGQKVLMTYATEVGHKNVDATASDNAIQSLEKIKRELADNQDTAALAESLKATNQLPQFKILQDVSYHAKANGIPITTDFSGAAAATPDTPSAQPDIGAVPSAKSNQKTVSLTVTFPDAVNYKKLLQFIADLEQNVPKMQLQGVSVTAQGSGEAVTVTPLIIDMYIR